MAGDIINLRRFRKQKARDDKRAEADANAVAHGTPKSLRELEAARKEKTSKDLDGKKLDTPNDD